jgi:hypothetical protein
MQIFSSTTRLTRNFVSDISLFTCFMFLFYERVQVHFEVRVLQKMFK